MKVKPDLSFILQNDSGSQEKYLRKNFELASNMLVRMLVKELNNEVRMDSSVYYGGQKVYRINSHNAYTLYVPKTVLIEKGFDTPLKFLVHLVNTIVNMDKVQLNLMFKEAKPIVELEMTEEGVDYGYSV